VAQRLEIIVKRSSLFFVSFLLAITFSIDAGGSSRAQGVLEIQIKDHRDAIDDFAKLDLSIEKILLSPRPGLKFWQTGWKELPVNAGSIDLTKYVGKQRALIYRGSIDAAWFDAFHLKLKSSDGTLKTGQRSIRIKANLNPVKLSFEVPARGETILVIDLAVTDFSDHPPRGYELNLRGYEVYTNGKLVDKIPPA
jgi:hypothetical protein